MSDRGRSVEVVPAGFDLVRIDTSDLIHLGNDSRPLCGVWLGLSYHTPNPPRPGEPKRVCRKCLAASGAVSTRRSALIEEAQPEMPIDAGPSGVPLAQEVALRKEVEIATASFEAAMAAAGKAEAERDALQAEVETWEHAAQDYSRQIQTLGDEVNARGAEVARLRGQREAALQTEGYLNQSISHVERQRDALADALQRYTDSDFCRCEGEDPCACCLGEAALRLAGRLPQ